MEPLNGKERVVNCANCGAALAPSARFCTQCGTPVAGPPPSASAAPTGASEMSDPQAYTNRFGERIDLPEPSVAMRGNGTTGMEYQVIGTTMQAVILELDPGETVYSESGGMAWMSGNIAMQTTGRGGRGSGRSNWPTAGAHIRPDASPPSAASVARPVLPPAASPTAAQ